MKGIDFDRWTGSGNVSRSRFPVVSMHTGADVEVGEAVGTGVSVTTCIEAVEVDVAFGFCPVRSSWGLAHALRIRKLTSVSCAFRTIK